jgi:hypothetical protein
VFGQNENVGFSYFKINEKNVTHSQLPLENWSDLLPFVPRPQLVALLFQLGDYQFASILQFCLNEDGHITLRNLRIRAPNENGPIVELCKMTVWNYLSTVLLETTLPDEPIPKNVHSFSSLTFRFLDIIKIH